MKSTRKTRKESIEKIKSFMDGNILLPDEQKSLQDVLDVLEDAEEYASLWNKIDYHIGISRISSIVTPGNMNGPSINLHYAEDLCNIISSVTYNVSSNNL